MSQLTVPSDWSPRGIKSRYRLLGLVAQGQFGRVYCAVHRASGQLVALKAIDSQRSTTSQFLRELTALVSLHHPHLAGLRAIEHTGRGRYLVLDYAAGGTLRQLMEAETPPRRSLLLHCLIDILDGLAHAHDRGIVHCDVKPENILLDVTPWGWRALLTDFGIAQSDGQGADLSLEQGGSPAYMAPERFSGLAYPASDLYGVGIILYEILLGDRPFQGRPGELRQAHLHQAIAWPEHLAPSWRSLLAQVLAKDVRQRLCSARALARALQQQLARLEGEGAEQSSAPPRGPGGNPGFFRPPPVAPLAWPPVQPQDCGRGTLAIALRPAAAPGLASLWRVQRSQLLPHPWAAAAPGQVGRRATMSSSGLSRALSPAGLRFPAPLTQVVGLPGGGFATTATALYRWSEPISGPADVAPGRSLDGPGAEYPSSARAALLDCCLAGEHPLGPLALAPDGSWGALLQRSPDGPRLVLFRRSGAGARPGGPAATGLRWLDCRLGGAPAALMILDRRYGVTLAPTGAEQASETQLSQLELFSRRGHWLASFSLPIAIRHCVRGQHPYELWAIEAQQPRTLLRIQLKPFRLERLPLAIAPQQIQPQSWGCLLANAAGQILAVDRSGQGLGQLQVPLQGEQQLQDLLAVGDRGLAVSLSAPQGLSLYQLDWAALALPLIF